MQMNTVFDGSKGTLVMNGRFDFNAHRDFRKLSTEVIDAPSVNHVLLDFGSVTYLDSAALGMLLMARERADGKGKKLTLVNCRGTVSQVLEVANFNKIFEVA